MKTIRIYEMFAGIGSQYKACKNIEKELDIKFESLGACEWFIDAVIGYMKIHYGQIKSENNLSKQEMIKLLSDYSWSADSKKPVRENYFSTMNEEKLRRIFPYLFGFVNKKYLAKKINIDIHGGESYTNIKKIDILPKDIDILTYSFPCQDISQQGAQKGITKQTRSGLLFEVERILKNNKDRLPKVLLLENVKALASYKFNKDFTNWLNTLKKLGYESKWKVINSADYGSYQNRERVFCISYLSKNKEFDFPKKNENKRTLKAIIKNEIDMQECNKLLKYFKDDFYVTKNNISKTKLVGYTNFNSEAYIYLPDKLGPTLTASGANSRLKFYFKETNELKLISAKQAFLYMGFNKKDYEAIKKDDLLTESKMIFLCGNSISVEVLECLFKEMILCEVV